MELDSDFCKRNIFKIKEGHVYFSSCGRYPLPSPSVSAGERELLKKQSKPWKISNKSVELQVKGKFAKLINGDERNVCIFPSTSYAITVASRIFGTILKKDLTVVVVDNDIESDVLPFQMMSKCTKLLRVKTDGDFNANLFEVFEQNNEIDVAVLPHCFWSTGQMIDFGRLLKLCSNRNIFLGK